MKVAKLYKGNSRKVGLIDIQSNLNGGLPAECNSMEARLI